jgi:MFS family permease
MFVLATVSFIQNPITLFAPLYLSDVLSIGPLAIGLLMVALPLSTLAFGPVGGRLSDRYNPRFIASVGVGLVLLGVVFYSQLGTSSAAILVVVPLVLVGAGLGLSRPASQVAVYSTVDRHEFGSLSALIISLTTLAGALGSTVTVAISEVHATSDSAVSFTDAQQFTFLLLVPLLVIALGISLLNRTARKPRDESEPQAASVAH